MRTKLEKMEDSCVFSGGDVDDVIVLSSDESQDEENKETVIKPGSEAKRKVRRRLLQSKEMTKVHPLAAGFFDREECNIVSMVQVVRIVTMEALRTVTM